MLYMAFTNLSSASFVLYIEFLLFRISFEFTQFFIENIDLVVSCRKIDFPITVPLGRFYLCPRILTQNKAFSYHLHIKFPNQSWEHQLSGIVTDMTWGVYQFRYCASVHEIIWHWKECCQRRQVGNRMTEEIDFFHSPRITHYLFDINWNNFGRNYHQIVFVNLNQAGCY